MINEALKCLTVELNEYLKNKDMLGSNLKPKVLLSGIVDQAGQVAILEENTIVVTLVNIEEEPVSKSYSLSNSRTSENVSHPVTINLYILFSSYFAVTNYEESLKFLALVISFLQEKNVFTSANSPTLSTNIEKMSVEMVTLSIEKLNNLWATLGAKYMPSVLYKLRMLTFTSNDLKEYRPVITTANEGNQ
jgi:hypothetical protein